MYLFNTERCSLSISRACRTRPLLQLKEEHQNHSHTHPIACNFPAATARLCVWIAGTPDGAIQVRDLSLPPHQPIVCSLEKTFANPTRSQSPFAQLRRASRGREQDYQCPEVVGAQLRRPHSSTRLRVGILFVCSLSCRHPAAQPYN